MDLAQNGCVEHALPNHLRESVRDVLLDGVAEQEVLLRDHADAPAEHGERDLPHIDPVHEERSGRDLEEPRDQIEERGLSAAGGSRDPARGAVRDQQG